MRTNTRVGDVFSVKTTANSKKYFQYVTNDLTQLNSNVIRAFKKVYAIDDSPHLLKIVNGDVQFYAHCIIKVGLKMNCWEKLGNISDIGKTDGILFRDSEDYGDPQIKISQNWWIWKINEAQKKVSKLVGENQKAEIGLVINPESIVYRMHTGEYDLKFYPKF